MALPVGTPAPDFTLYNQDKEQVSLSSYRGKNVILVFYPAAFTGVCKAEVCSFQNAIQRLNNANAEVIGISADSPFANQAFKEANGLQFPLLTDLNLETIKKYDVLFNDFGIPGLTRSERATFILDANGVIQYVQVTPKPSVEPNYDEIFAAAEAV